MRKKLLIIILTIFMCTGCMLDPYDNKDNAEKAINVWFSYKNGNDDLGSTRKKIENIHTIKDVDCNYVANDNYLRYVYECTITYIPIGETIIPLAQDDEKKVYVVISYNEDRTYNYVVYNSSSPKGIWEHDELLGYSLPKTSKNDIDK